MSRWKKHVEQRLVQEVELLLDSGSTLEDACEMLAPEYDRTPKALTLKYHQMKREKPSFAVNGLQELLEHFESMRDENEELKAQVKELQQQQKDYEDLSRLLLKAREQFVGTPGKKITQHPDGTISVV